MLPADGNPLKIRNVSPIRTGFRDDHERRHRVQKYARCKINRLITRMDTGFTKAKSLICSGILLFQFQYDAG